MNEMARTLISNSDPLLARPNCFTEKYFFWLCHVSHSIQQIFLFGSLTIGEKFEKVFRKAKKNVA